MTFLPTFAAILLGFDVAQRVARLLGPRPQEHVASALQVALLGAFRLCDTRLLVERTRGMCSMGSYIFVSNHQSVFDIPIIGTLLRSNFPKYVSKRELARCRPLSQSHPPERNSTGIVGGSLRRRRASTPSAREGSRS